MTRPLAAIACVAMAASPARADCPAAGDPLYIPAHASGVCLRPAPSLPPLRIGVELLGGAHDADVELAGGAAGLAVPLEIALSPALSVAARVSVVRGREARVDADGDGRDDARAGALRASSLTAGATVSLFTEPSRREAVRLAAGAGWLSLRGPAAVRGGVVEIGVGRQVGTLRTRPGPDRPTHGHAHDVALTVHARHGVGGARRYRALLVGASYAVEAGVALPPGVRQVPRRPRVEHTAGVDGAAAFFVGERGGAGGGVGLFVGLPFKRAVELRARADTARVRAEQGAFAIHAVVAGLRLSRWALPYAELLLGYAGSTGTRPRPFEAGPVLEVATGAQVPNALGCGLGVFLRAGLRAGLGAGTRELRAGSLGLGVSYDSLIGARECR